MYDELVKELREAEKRAKEICTNPYRFVPYYGKAADAIEELSQKYIEERNVAVELTGEIASMPRWIPVTERLPELNMSCLVYNKYYGPMVGCRIDDNRFRIPGSYFPDHPTHWMPLPELPGEET